MGKRENQTIYYCDCCRQPIIETPAVFSSAQITLEAPNTPIEGPLGVDAPFFTPIVGHFYNLKTEITPTDIDMASGTATAQLKVEPQDVYLCKGCGDKIAEDYVKILDELSDLFEWMK